jgi:hypothetical protein
MTVDPTFVSPVAPNTSASPEWENIAVEAKCPLCDYNLRGLVEPRCPECGYQFDWPSVLDADKRKHPYLFEHHPERNVRSFLQTSFHSLKPSVFWQTLQPTHRVRPRRAVLYWAPYSLMPLLAAGVAVFEAVRVQMLFPAFRPPWAAPPSLSFDYVLQSVGGRPGAYAILAAVALLAIWPWLNFLALMIFQQSMRRAHVKPSHVVRCAIYSGDLIFWYSLLAAGAVLLVGPTYLSWPIANFLLFLTLGAILTGIVIAVRMWIAYRRYMKFDHAFATILASQIIVVLTIFTLLMCIMTR